MRQEKQKWEEELASAKENKARAEGRLALLAEEKDQACRFWREAEEKLTAAEVWFTARQSTAHSPCAPIPGVWIPPLVR